MNRYHVCWFDDTLWRTMSFYLVAENESQIIDWVFDNYRPRGNKDIVNVQLIQGGLKFPIMVER